jgi:hypothetical protein
MRSFVRILLMALVSLVVLTVCLGGGLDSKSFGFIGSLVVIFWGLPLLGFISLLHFVERWSGQSGSWLIAMVGLIPLGFCASFGFRGDQHFMMQMVMAGLAWSAAWIATSRAFVDHQNA